MSMPCSLYIKVDIFLFPRTFSKKNLHPYPQGEFPVTQSRRRMGGVRRRRREKRVERRAGMSELRHCVQLSHNHKKRESERKEGGGREE